MSGAVWQQLGEQLRRRREDLEPRYAGQGGLTLFAEERSINRRVAWDIENGKRDNYTRAVRREIEIAYGLPLRWIDDFLAQAQANSQPRYADPALQYIWETPGLDAEVREALVKLAVAMREQDKANSEPA